jgi:hypothetical protein
MKDIKEQLSELREESKELTRKIDRLEKELKPEFKAGQWVVVDLPSGKIKRIFAIQGDRVYFDYFDKEDQMKKSSFPLSFVTRPATREEIESHLRSICDPTYVGKYVASVVNSECRRKVLAFSDYDFERDAITYDCTDAPMTIYQKGTFATILPSLKPAPETFDELLQFGVDIQKEYIKNGPLSVAYFIRKNYDI